MKQPDRIRKHSDLSQEQRKEAGVPCSTGPLLIDLYDCDRDRRVDAEPMRKKMMDAATVMGAEIIADSLFLPSRVQSVPMPSLYRFQDHERW